MRSKVEITTKKKHEGVNIIRVIIVTENVEIMR